MIQVTLSPAPGESSVMPGHAYQHSIRAAICLLASTGTLIKFYTNVIITLYCGLTGGVYSVISITELGRCGSAW